MGLNAVLTFVSTLLTGVGFIMPIPVLADNSKQFIKKDVLRLLLWAFVGENYDEVRFSSRVLVENSTIRVTGGKSLY